MRGIVRITVATLFVLVWGTGGVAAQNYIGVIQADRGADGNRFVRAPLPLARMNNDRIMIDRNAEWVAGYVLDGRPEWIVRLDDESFIRVRIEGERPISAPIAAPRTDGALGDRDEHPTTLTLEWDTDRRRWLPLPLGAYPAGYLDPSLPAPLPDGHIAAGRDQVVAYLSHPTGRYAHGVIGDAIEAGGLTILSAAPPRTVEFGEAVAEERGVLLTDLGQNGSIEIVTVLAGARVGAWLAAFSVDGRLVAEGEAIGTGFRWRHLIGAGPLGPMGEELVAAVRTPHIGGTIEYHDENLEVVARAPGYSSHGYGVRSVGDAWIVNVDGDERWEIVLPTQRRTRLEAVTLSPQGPQVLWSYELGAPLSSNLAPADPRTDRELSPGAGGGMLVGTRDGALHVWW